MSRTRVLDPVIDIENNRVEFRLSPGSVYSASMRILNLGGILSTAPARYNRQAGGLSLIKNIYLVDGEGTTLDQLIDANKWIAFKKYNTGHMKARSLDRNLIGNDLGKAYSTLNLVENTIIPKPIGITTAQTGKCVLDLKETLPFLKNLQVLPTTIFGDVRIIIEYETSVLNISTIDNDTFKTLSSPLLVVQEIVDQEVVMELTKSFAGVGWMAIERDVGHVSNSPLAVALQPQISKSNSVLFKGFDNKTLSRVLVVVQPTSLASKKSLGGAVYGAGDLGACVLVAPTFQFVVNGMNKFAGNGLSRSNEILSRLVDTFGECSTTLGGAATSFYNAPEAVLNNKETDGRTGYVGISINDRIKNLSLRVDNTAQFNQSPLDTNLEQFNSSFNLVMFGECRKSLLMNTDGSYVITYN